MHECSVRGMEITAPKKIDFIKADDISVKTYLLDAYKYECQFALVIHPSLNDHIHSNFFITY